MRAWFGVRDWASASRVAKRVRGGKGRVDRGSGEAGEGRVGL